MAEPVLQAASTQSNAELAMKRLSQLTSTLLSARGRLTTAADKLWGARPQPDTAKASPLPMGLLGALDLLDGLTQDIHKELDRF